MLNLKELDKRFDKLFREETPESFERWLKKERAMTKEQKKGNKIIADFLKIPKCKRCSACGKYKFGAGLYCTPEEMKYHSSLDWLKPAIDKFLSISSDEFNYDVVKMTEFRMVRKSLSNMPISKSIDDFFNELVTVIIWYNKDFKL